MRFYGVIEASPEVPFMLGLPILGMCFDKDKLYIGPITGNMEDIKMGHSSKKSYEGFKDFISDLYEYYSTPPDYSMKICTYKEACDRYIEILNEVPYNKFFDKFFLINKLEKVS